MSNKVVGAMYTGINLLETDNTFILIKQNIFKFFNLQVFIMFDLVKLGGILNQKNTGLNSNCMQDRLAIWTYFRYLPVWEFSPY